MKFGPWLLVQSVILYGILYMYVDSYKMYKVGEF
jgi:hypothetical protein